MPGEFRDVVILSREAATKILVARNCILASLGTTQKETPWRH
ncbi:MAG: hypothetical protein ACYDBL_05785 [Candidatus Acidiferrales bacterium]